MPTPKTTNPKDPLKLQYIALSEILPWPENPKTHDVEAIKESIRLFGYRDPIELDPETRRVLAGHGRDKALRELEAEYELEGKAPPAGIFSIAGKWQVQVLLGKKFENPGDPEAYLLANNKTQALGGYNKADLKAMLERVQTTRGSLSGTGFSEEDFQSLQNRSRATLTSLTGVGAATPQPITDAEAQDILDDSQTELTGNDPVQRKAALPQLAKDLGRALVFYLKPDKYEWVYGVLQEIQAQEGYENLPDALVWALEQVKAGLK